MATTIDVKVQFTLGGEMGECLVYDKDKEVHFLVREEIMIKALAAFNKEKKDKFFLKILKPLEDSKTFTPVEYYEEDLGW